MERTISWKKVWWQRECDYQLRADNYWIMSDSREHLETIVKELTVAADGLELEQKTQSVVDEHVRARVQDRHEHCGGGQDLSFSVDGFVILGHSSERSGRGISSLGGRLAEGTKALLKEARISRSNLVSVKQKCSRMVSHIYSIVSLGCDNWSWPQHTMNRLKRWETVMMRRIFYIHEER